MSRHMGFFRVALGTFPRVVDFDVSVVTVIVCCVISRKELSYVIPVSEFSSKA